MTEAKKKISTTFIVQFAVLLAIEILFCFTPLGSLPAIGPIVATLAMIPVIITAIMLGTRAGSLMGFFAGLFSFLVWTFMPPVPIVAFVFTPFYTMGEFSGNAASLLICFVPRILTGTVAGMLNNFLNRRLVAKKALCYPISAFLGSLINTFGVLGGIWIFFGNQYASIAGEVIFVIIGMTVLTSGIPEAIVAAIAAAAICPPLKIITNKR